MKTGLVFPQRQLLLFLVMIFITPLIAASTNDAHRSNSAEAFLKSGVLHKALLGPDWEAVIKSVPDSTVARDPRVMLLLGHASYGLGQNNTAAAIFTLISDSASLAHWEKWTNVFSAQNASSTVAHYLYGDALARNEKFDQALKEFTEAIKLNEKFCLALNARGAVYDIKDNLDKASDDFEVATEYCPDFADTYAGIGVIYLQRGFLGAGEQFTKAIEKDSTHALAYNGQACNYASKKDFEMAENSIIIANNYLKGNPYIVMNARAFINQKDSTSTLGRIANQKILTNPRGLAQLAYAILPNTKLTIGGPKILELQLKWSKDFLYKDIETMKPGVLRGGVYFDIQHGQNLKINDIETKRKVSTEFTLGYPRSKR